MTIISPKEILASERTSDMEMIWHEHVLLLREQQRKAGNQTPLNWETAKQKIRNQVDNLPPTKLSNQFNRAK